MKVSLKRVNALLDEEKAVLDRGNDTPGGNHGDLDDAHLVLDPFKGLWTRKTVPGHPQCALDTEKGALDTKSALFVSRAPFSVSRTPFFCPGGLSFVQEVFPLSRAPFSLDRTPFPCPEPRKVCPAIPFLCPAIPSLCPAIPSLCPEMGQPRPAWPAHGPGLPPPGPGVPRTCPGGRLSASCHAERACDRVGRCRRSDR